MVNCYAYQNPVYTNPKRLIASMTNAFPVSITTTFDHGYSSGLIVRLFIPAGIGMQLANTLYAPITVTSPTTFTMPIDTTKFDPYNVSNAWWLTSCGQVVPIGEVSDQLYQATVNQL